MTSKGHSLVRRFVAVTAAAIAACTTIVVTPAQAAGDIDLCVSVGRVAGFSGENFVVAVAVAMAESRCDPAARGVNPGHSIDRGLWQINDYYHPDVSDACAYNAQCNANAAFRISDRGGDWSPWSTYRSGSYRQFLDDARAAIGATPPPPKAAKSINGDKYDDAVGVDADGVAWLYPGKSGGGFGARSRIGAGWTGFGRVAIGDANADGWADLFATNGSALFHWRNRGNGSFSEGVQVGTGWSVVDHFSVADVNGDNKADILARDGGNLNLYVGKGTGGFAAADLLGPGWSAYPRHTAADADGDGDGDIWAITSAGALSFWKRNGDSYGNGVQVGSGWSGFGQLTTMDINGDAKADVVAVRSSDGTLWQWLGTGNGSFGQAKQIGTGWKTVRLAAY